MTAFLKNLFFLLVIYVVLTLLALITDYLFTAGIPFIQTAVLLTGGLIISFIVSLIFFSGFGKSEAARVQRTLLAIVLKFILYGALIGLSLLWFKSLTITFILTFFIIYLAFTIYLLLTFVNVLKFKKL
jgi:hypothetical protein